MNISRWLTLLGLAVSLFDASTQEAGPPQLGAEATTGSVRRARPAAKQKLYDRTAGLRPDLEDAPYGSHERLKLDLWKAKSTVPVPLLVFFHGGGGDKLMWRGNRPPPRAEEEFILKHFFTTSAPQPFRHQDSP